MTPRRPSRWTALLVLPVLVGALLLLHGLSAGSAGEPIDGAARTAPVHRHDADSPANHEDGHCAGCTATHVMATCVAIVVTVAGLRLVRRASGRVFRPALDAISVALRDGRAVHRAQEPAWVRLAVMRC